MRTRTLNSSSLIAGVGTIRGGSFLSAILASRRFRLWLLTAGPLPHPLS